MNDRIEEYRRDWTSGPVAAPRAPSKRRVFYQRASFRWLSLVLLVASCLLLFQLQPSYLPKWMNDHISQLKTDLELSTAQRLLRTYYVTHGELPNDPQEYLRTSMRKNKPTGPATDFWGTPYQVERDWDGFWVRSAGMDRKFGTRDDRSGKVKFPDKT